MQQDRSEVPAAALGECAVLCLAAGLRRGKKTLLLHVSQNLLFGDEALHPGFPSSLVRVDIYFYFFLSRCSAQDQPPASFASVLCRPRDVAHRLPCLGRERATAQAGFGGAVPRAAPVVLRQLHVNRSNVIRGKQLCECSWQNNFWFLP